MDDTNEHDHNDFYEVEPPSWKFSLWDVAGIALQTTGGILAALAGGAHLLSQECAASANRSRKTWDLRQAERKQAEAQAEIGADIRALIEGPE